MSLKDKIILHLGKYSGYTWDFPYALCQTGIAEELGTVRTNIARVLYNMQSENLLEVEQNHVIGLKRKRLTYMLSEKGREIFKGLYYGTNENDKDDAGE